jgi:hypothetical protein
MKHTWLLFFLLLQPLLRAQNNIPAGTVLPVRLSSGLNAGKIKAGNVIRTQVMQDIPDTAIRRGAKVLGHVVSVTPTRLELRFDTLVTKQTRIPLTTQLRALASMLEVDRAQVPQEGGDRGMPSFWDLTTSQIGGEQVYRGAGFVSRGVTRVAEPTGYGVLGKLNSNPPCRGNDSRQALWLFSTDACGVYGFNDLAIEHWGRTGSVGTIVLVSKTEKINIRAGSGLLLRVNGE